MISAEMNGQRACFYAVMFYVLKVYFMEIKFSVFKFRDDLAKRQMEDDKGALEFKLKSINICQKYLFILVIKNDAQK